MDSYIRRALSVAYAINSRKANKKLHQFSITSDTEHVLEDRLLFLRQLHFFRRLFYKSSLFALFGAWANRPL